METNLTRGSVPKHIIGFAAPTILGNLFQLSYNAADSIIIERFAGSNDLAAAATASPIMNIVIFFIVGICLGASILLGEFYGANDLRAFKRELSTSFIGGLVFTVVLAVLLIVFTKPILRALQTPEEVIPLSAGYLYIVYAGLIFTFIYNIYASALRAIGDARTPIIFLVVSAVVNVALDLLFVAGFDTGALGAAVATTIAQTVSGLLCIAYVRIKIPLLSLKRREWIVDKILLIKTVSYSWASAMQQTCLYFGKLLIQGAVNPLGVDAIVAFNAVNRLDDFAFTPQQSIAHAMSAVIAQNRGAAIPKREKSALRWGMLFEFIYGIIIGAALYIFATPAMRLFADTSGQAAIDMGLSYIHIIAFIYTMPAVTNGLQGYFRGMGLMKVTLMSTALQIATRVIASYILAPMFGIQGIALSCGIGWIAMLAYEVPMLLHNLKHLNTEIRAFENIAERKKNGKYASQ